jgi:imidazolonepropionase-like amidohydrolase
MSPSEVLCGVTSAAAAAVGLGHDRGFLAPGFAADVAVIEAEIGADRRAGITGSQFPDDEAVDATTTTSDVELDPRDGVAPEREEER